MITTIPRQARRTRGLADLRTMTGARNAQAEPYKAFLRISFLELEQARHRREMQKVHRHVDAIAERCREIEREKARLLATLNEAPAPARPTGGELAAGLRRRRFHLSY